MTEKIETPVWNKTHEGVRPFLLQVAKTKLSNLTPTMMFEVLALGFLQVAKNQGFTTHDALLDLERHLAWMQGDIAHGAANVASSRYVLQAVGDDVRFLERGNVVMGGTPEFRAALSRVQRLGSVKVSATFTKKGGGRCEFFTEETSWLASGLGLRQRVSYTGRMSIGGSRIQGWPFRSRNSHMALVAASLYVPTTDDSRFQTSYRFDTAEDCSGKYSINTVGAFDYYEGMLALSNPVGGMVFVPGSEDAGSVLGMFATERGITSCIGVLRADKARDGTWGITSTQTILCTPFE